MKLISQSTLQGLLAGGLACATVNASTIFQTQPNSLATATWESWSWQGAVDGGGFSGTVLPGQSGSQGPAVTSNQGINITSSSVTTTILDDYGKPPGGLTGGGDAYYIHDGAFQWDSAITTDSAFEFIRFSYSLVGFGGDPAQPFDQVGSVAGATALTSGSYLDANGRSIFYHDFAMNSPATTASLSFGDVVTPGFFPGSFRSLDAIQVETFGGAAPAAPIPEPTSSLLLVLSSLVMLRRRRA